MGAVLWSHCVSWTDLIVPIGVGQGGAGLDLAEDWPRRWSVSWKSGRALESCSVWELAQSPVTDVDPIRGFSWRRGQRHRPGLEFLVSTGRHHGFESLEEARVLLALDFAGDLVDVVSQPLKIRFGTAGDRKPRDQTPDFLAVTRFGVWLIDVRPEPLIRDEDWESFAAAGEVALACGWHFVLLRVSMRTKDFLIRQYVSETFSEEVEVPSYRTWPTRMSKTQRTEHAREVTQAEAAGTDRPTQAPDEHDDRLGPSLPQTVTPLRWPTRAAQAADGIDTERRRRREAAVPVAPKPPPALGSSFRQRNMFLLPEDDQEDPVTEPPAAESPIVPFLRAGPPPDRTRWEGWQQWRAMRGTFTPASWLSLREYSALSPRRKALHDLHRTATHVNMRLQETPMSLRVSGFLRGRLQNNAVKFMPGTRDGLMIKRRQDPVAVTERMAR